MSAPSVSTLFSKPDIAQLRISPAGSYLVWLERDPARKVLNFYGQVQHPQNGKPGNEQVQITYFDDYDATVHYVFSGDEKYILFLREPVLGKEMYHLYSLDLEQCMTGTEKSTGGDDETKNLGNIWQSHMKDRTPDPYMTCCIGFVGGIQLWTSTEHPNEVYLATGPGSMFWNLSKLYLSEDRLELVERHPLGDVFDRNPETASKLKKGVAAIKTVAKTGYSLAKGYLGMFGDDMHGKLPVEWFVDTKTWTVRGRTDASIRIPTKDTSTGLLRQGTTVSKFYAFKPQLHCSFSVKKVTSDNNGAEEWCPLLAICFDDLNLQLIGAAGGTGLTYMDFRETEVDIHVCRPDCDVTLFETYSLETMQFVRRLERKDTHSKKTDIAGFLRDPSKKCVTALVYEYSRPEKVFLDREECRPTEEVMGSHKPFPFTQEDADFIDKELQGCAWNVASSTDTGSTMLLYVYGASGLAICNNAPDGYFTYHRGYDGPKTVRGLTLFHRIPRPKLRDYSLGDMLPFDFKSPRDGITIPCLLTLPPLISISQVSDKEPKIPLVVFPHGGPNYRDFWGYNPMVQVLATRGIAVLQPNYRGSTGYGQSFQAIGMDGEFCKGMQLDIQDVADYITYDVLDLNQFREESDGNKLLSETESNPFCIDPTKVAIIGGSFGGYSAMHALCGFSDSTPKLRYSCGVSFVGLYEVGKLFLDKPCFRGDPLVSNYFRKVFGPEYSNSEEKAKEVSPLYHGDKVKVPMMLMHGENDPRCPFDCATQLAESINNSEFWAFAKEGHGFQREPNRILMWTLTIEFLEQHLLGKSRQSEDDLLKQVEGHTARRVK